MGDYGGQSPLWGLTGVYPCAVGPHISSAAGQGDYGGQSPLWGITWDRVPCAQPSMP